MEDIWRLEDSGLAMAHHFTDWYRCKATYIPFTSRHAAELPSAAGMNVLPT
jgi:hypothetical protein